MLSELKPAILITVVFTILTGIAYPLAITGIAQAIFPYRANGSLVPRNGRLVGSELIAQNFSKPEYFHPRPSAAGQNGYDATSSGPSNVGPTSQALADRLKKDAAAWRTENPDYHGAIPADAITTSGSGLDPEISIENARAQALRVGQKRGSVENVLRILSRMERNRDLGLLGERRVNVLNLNMALDAELPMKP